jgi:hypothetical protein
MQVFRGAKPHHEDGTNEKSCRLAALFLLFRRKILHYSKKVRIFTRFFNLIR